MASPSIAGRQGEQGAIEPVFGTLTGHAWASLGDRVDLVPVWDSVDHSTTAWDQVRSDPRDAARLP